MRDQQKLRADTPLPAFHRHRVQQDIEFRERGGVHAEFTAFLRRTKEQRVAGQSAQGFPVGAQNLRVEHEIHQRQRLGILIGMAFARMKQKNAAGAQRQFLAVGQVGPGAAQNDRKLIKVMLVILRVGQFLFPVVHKMNRFQRRGVIASGISLELQTVNRRGALSGFARKIHVFNSIVFVFLLVSRYNIARNQTNCKQFHEHVIRPEDRNGGKPNRKGAPPCNCSTGELSELCCSY